MSGGRPSRLPAPTTLTKADTAFACWLTRLGIERAALGLPPADPQSAAACYDAGHTPRAAAQLVACAGG